MPMIQAFISSQRAAATAVAFILTYFVALTLGRFFKRRAQLPLGGRAANEIKTFVGVKCLDK